MAEIPQIYGLEHERRLVAEPGGHLHDPNALYELLHTAGICGDGTDIGGFSILNGSKHYVDSYDPDADIKTLGNNAAYETATPETTSLRELRKYSRGVDVQAIRAIQTYLGACSDLNAIHYNHRASLGRGATYATQLNYGLPHAALEGFGFGSYSGTHFAQSIVHAAFLTGGGVLNGSSIALSQKAAGLTAVQGRHGNRGTVYQVPTKRGEWSTLQRVEVRLADAHPGEWEGYLHAGLGAIALTVAQMPQAQLEQTFSSPLTDKLLLRQAKAQNSVQIDTEGLLYPVVPVHAAVNWTRQLAETFLAMPRRGTEGEEDLVLAAEEIVAYCGLAQRVYDRKATVHELAKQGVGWAKRAVHAMSHSTQTGMIDFSHPDCITADAAYDLVHIEPDNVTYGPAFTNENLPTRWQLSDEEILQAETNPPADTVAAYRVRLLQAHRRDVAAMNWSRVEIWQPDGSLGIMYTSNPLNPVDGM